MQNETGGAPSGMKSESETIGLTATGNRIGNGTLGAIAGSSMSETSGRCADEDGFSQTQLRSECPSQLTGCGTSWQLVPTASIEMAHTRIAIPLRMTATSTNMDSILSTSQRLGRQTKLVKSRHIFSCAIYLNSAFPLNHQENSTLGNPGNSIFDLHMYIFIVDYGRNQAILGLGRFCCGCSYGCSIHG